MDSASAVTDRGESRSWQLYVAVCTTLPPLLIAFALRIGIKIVKKTKLGLDDYFMIAAVISDTIGSSFDLVSTANGLGKHIDTLSEAHAIQAAKYAFLSELFAIFSVWLIKQSVCFFLLRIIDRTHRKSAWAIWALITLNTASTFVTCVLWGIQARPIDSLWDPNIPGTKLAPSVAISSEYATGSLAALTDVFCALTPIYFLRSLKIGRSRKLWLMALMLGGILTSLTSILKVVFLGQLATATDITWEFVKDFVLSILEKNVGAFLANLPLLLPFFSKVAQLLRDSAAYSLITHTFSNLTSRSHDEGSEKGAHTDAHPTFYTGAGSHVDHDPSVAEAPFGPFAMPVVVRTQKTVQVQLYNTRRPSDMDLEASNFTESTADYDGNDQDDHVGLVEMLRGSRLPPAPHSGQPQGWIDETIP